MKHMFEFVFTNLDPLIKESERKEWNDDNTLLVLASDVEKTGIFVAGSKKKLIASLADAIVRDERVSNIVRRALQLVDGDKPKAKTKKASKNPFLGDIVKKPLN